MTRYWISWECTADDYRPLTFPPNESILGYWCSGTSADDNHIMCALVDAASEEAAMAAVCFDWPEARLWLGNHGWRFCHVVGADWILSDRFQLADWMRERIDAAKGLTE